MRDAPRDDPQPPKPVPVKYVATKEMERTNRYSIQQTNSSGEEQI